MGACCDVDSGQKLELDSACLSHFSESMFVEKGGRSTDAGIWVVFEVIFLFLVRFQTPVIKKIESEELFLPHISLLSNVEGGEDGRGLRLVSAMGIGYIS